MLFTGVSQMRRTRPPPSVTDCPGASVSYTLLSFYVLAPFIPPFTSRSNAHADAHSHLILQTPSQLSALCVKYAQRWWRSPELCWTAAMLTSCYGPLVWRCSVALDAATPKVCSVSPWSPTCVTCR